MTAVDRELEFANPSYEAPGVRLTFTTNLSPGAQLGFETVFSQYLSAEEMDALADKLEHVASRQKAKIEFAEHERQLLLTEQQLKDTAADLVRRKTEAQDKAAETGRRNVRLSNAEVANLDQMRVQVETLKTQIEMRKAAMQKCRDLIGGQPVYAEAAE